MSPILTLKAVFLIIPFMFLAFAVLPLRWLWRIPAGAVLGVAIAFALAAFFPGGMDYIVSFSIMASEITLMATRRLRSSSQAS